MSDADAYKHVAGFAVFGLAARFWQLGIQKRPLLHQPLAHAAAMGIFGFAGYWVYWGDQRVQELIREKRIEIAERRAQQALKAAERELYQLEATRAPVGEGAGI